MRTCILVLGVLFLIRCQTPESSLKRIIIEVEEKQEILQLSTLFDSLHYIPLETVNSSILEGIDRLCLDSRENIYILDQEGTNAVLKFDRQGRFMGKIGYQGRGPGEYLEISDFCIYQDTLVEILDAMQEKRIQYSTNGSFVREYLHCDAGDGDFLHFGDTLIFYSPCGGYCPNLKICIRDQEYGFFKQNTRELWKKFEYIHTTGDRIFYSDNYNDTIYHFADGQLLPWLYIDFDGKNLPAGFQGYEKVAQSPYCWNVDNIKVMDRYIYFDFNYKEQTIQAFVDTETDEKYVFRILRNDIDHVPFLIFPKVCTCPEKIVTYLTATMLIESYAYNKRAGEKISEVFDTLYHSISEDSNPVLVFAYLKNKHRI